MKLCYIDSMNDTIINRVKKLLNLSKEGNGASQAEAENALLRARRLALDHDLDLAILSQTEIVKEEQIENQKIDLGQRFSVCQKFVNFILQAHFKVKIVMGGGRDGGRYICLVGKTSDVAIAQYVQGFLNQEFMRLWRVAKVRNNYPAKDRNSYIFGLYKGLTQKLQQEEATVKGERFSALALNRGVDFASNTKESYALALVDHSARLEQAMSRFHGKVRTIRTSVGRVRNANALETGREAGRNINLNRAIGGGRPADRLS